MPVKRLGVLRFCLATTLWMAWTATPAGASDDIFAVQSRFVPANFQLFLNLADDSSVVNSDPVFGSSGGVYAATFLGETLYAAELASDLSADYLATIPHSGPLIGQVSRVSDNPIGFANIESLVAADGELYAGSINFAAHRTTLLTVDPVSGVGAAVGQGSIDVILVGLAFDPIGDVLYGEGIPFGATGVNTPNLYTVDRTNGATTLVGQMGTTVQSLAWDDDLGLIGALDRLYQLDTQTGAATPLGGTDFTQGVPGVGNGIYALAAISDVEVPGDFNGNGVLDTADIDDLTERSASSSDELAVYDLNLDGVVDTADVTFWAHELFGTWIGDANLSGEFDSQDTIDVLAELTYEMPDTPAVWTSGDFNGSGRFDSQDLVEALADLGYENGPYVGVAAVPEPADGRLIVIAFAAWVLAWRSRREPGLLL